MNRSYVNPYRSHVAATSVAQLKAAPGDTNPHQNWIDNDNNNDRNIVEALHQLTLAWDDEVIRTLTTDLWSARPPSLWNWSTVAVFLEFVFLNRHNEHQRNCATVLLARLVDDATEEQVYAIALFRPDSIAIGGGKHNSRSHSHHLKSSSSSFTAIDILSQRLRDAMTVGIDNTNKDEASHDLVSLTFLSSLIALTSLWRALDRLDKLLSFSWWGSHPNDAAVVSDESHAGWWRRMNSTAPSDPKTANPTAWMVPIFAAIEALEDGDQTSAVSSPTNRIQIPSVADMKSVGLRPEDVQTSVLTYLHHSPNVPTRASATTLLGNNNEWTQKLFVLASRLCDRDMPRTSYTHLSLAALQLLVGQPSQTSHSTLQPVITIVARSLMDVTGDHRLPRWASPHSLHHPTHTHYRDDLYKWTFGIVLDWTRLHHHALSTDVVTPASVRTLWTASGLLVGPPTSTREQSSSSPPAVPVDVAAALLVVATQFRGEAREGLEMALQEQPWDATSRSTSHDLRRRGMEALVSRSIKDSSLGSVLLMNVWVSDGQSKLTHDRWSQAFWQALTGSDPTTACAPSDAPTKSGLEECVQFTLRTADEASVAQEKGLDRHLQYAMMHPKLQCYLDLLHGLLTHVEAKAGIACIAQTLHSAQSIETLVQIMSPKQAKVDYTRDHGEDDTTRSFSLNFDESVTPTANNLSRVDASLHVCLQEYEHLPVGREPIVRLACANVLAAVSHSLVDVDPDDSLMSTRRPPLQARIIEAVNSFVEELGLDFVMTPFPASLDAHSHEDDVRFHFSGTLEMTQRRLRLVTTLASSTDNLVYLASVMHRAEASQLREAKKRHTELMETTLRVQELLKRAKDLEAEKAGLEGQLVSQQAALQEKMARFQRSCSQNAKQLVHVHQVEASRAERRAEEVVMRMKNMQDQLAHAERKIETSRKLEEESHKALENAQKSVEELRRNHEAVLMQSEACARELEQATIELQRTKPKVERLIRNERKMLTHIQLQDESLVELGESRDALKDSLETLFADMVSLARLYESKEKEEYKCREQEETTIEDLTRQLRAERARYAQLEATYKQTEVNNNMLSSKYEKVRKLLEQEREERNSESARFAAEQRKRYGPASYMSHLHPTTGHASSKTNSHERMRLVLSNDGKENDRSTTSSASRSSHSKSSSAANSGRQYR